MSIYISIARHIHMLYAGRMHTKEYDLSRCQGSVHGPYTTQVSQRESYILIDRTLWKVRGGLQIVPKVGRIDHHVGVTMLRDVPLSFMLCNRLDYLLCKPCM